MVFQKLNGVHARVVIALLSGKSATAGSRQNVMIFATLI